MVITISGTQVQIIGEPDIIFQNNNLVNTLAAVTDKDESWQYNVDIFMPNSKLTAKGAWEKAMEGAFLRTNLKGEDVTALKSLGKMLGNTDVDRTSKSD